MAAVVSYTTVSLMQVTLSEIGSMTTINSFDLSYIAEGAENIINAKIAKKYSIPITGVIPLLKTVATDMSIYRVLTGRTVINKDSPWFQRYKEAEKTLDAIANGTIPLITSSGDVVTTRSDAVSGMKPWSNNMEYNPTFWEGPITQQFQDADKIEEQGDDRDISGVEDRLK